MYLKKRFEEQRFVSPDYVIPDGTEDSNLIELYKNRYE